MNENDGMGGFFQPSTPLPCRDCLVTLMQMSLEYVDGTAADASTGMWLHHGVMENRNRTDSVCGPKTYGQRFFASGNERTVVDISASGYVPQSSAMSLSLFTLSKSFDRTVKAGYYIGHSDVVALSVELMNMLHSQSQEGVVVTVTYEFIQGRHPEEFSAVTPYWLDIGSCRTSDFPAYRNTTFEYTSPSIEGLPRGQLTFVAGHVHDGGTHIELLKNGRVLCSLNATYGAFRYLKAADFATEHISSIAACEMPGKTAPDDEWSIIAHYDTTLHDPMLTMDGSLEPVMGIMLAYVANESRQALASESKWLNIVLGWGIGIAIALLVVAWFWLRSEAKRSTRARSSYLEEETKVPLMGF
jgi:hypothetical protein